MIRRISGLAVVAALAVALVSGPLQAAEPVYPPASHLGLSPPSGFVASRSFPGFENADTQAAIVMQELPAAIYDYFDKGMTAENLKTQSITLERRDALTLPSGPAFLMTGTQEENGTQFRKWVLVASATGFTAVVTMQVPANERSAIPDEAARSTLATLVVRDKIPVAEQLDTLPYQIGDLGGFRLVRVLPGSAALLTDGPNDEVEVADQPLIVITLAPGAPADASDRAAFARRVFGGIPGLKEIRLTRSEPLRLGGQPGYETLADAKDSRADTDLSVVQWLRFGGSGYLRMVGVARKDDWPKMFTRFRTVRDSITPR